MEMLTEIRNQLKGMACGAENILWLPTRAPNGLL
jgi:hypothetical protein